MVLNPGSHTEAGAEVMNFAAFAPTIVTIHLGKVETNWDEPQLSLVSKPLSRVQTFI